MDQPTHSLSDSLLVDCSLEQLPLDDRYLVVVAIEGIGFALGRSVASFRLQADLREDRREELLTSPEFLRFHDCWDRDLAIPVLNPHQHIETQVFLDECATFRHLLNGK